MENLPNEILVSVFKHLQQKDLVRVSRVCKQFCLVVDEFNLIKKLHFGVHNDDSVIPARQYSEAKFISYKPEIHLRVLEALGDQLTLLEVSQFTMNLIDVVNILRATPNVKSLSFDYVNLDDDSLSSTVELPQLHLENLLCNESNPTIFAALQQCSLEAATLSFYGDTPYSNFAQFMSLLQRQKCLTSLAISGLYEANLLTYPMRKPIMHQLKEFRMRNCDLEEWEELGNYLMEHVKTLEKLELIDLNWDPSFVLNQCTKLQSFTAENITINSIEQLPTIEVLSIKPSPALMDNFPNVKKLFIHEANNETLQTISRSMSKLEDIHIQYGGTAGLEAPTLRKATLQNIDEPIDPNFFVVHSKIEELTFLNTFDVDDNLLEVITSNLKSLRILRLIGMNELTERAYQIIHDNCKNTLQVLEMTKWDQQFTRDDWGCLYDIKGLRVYQELEYF